MRVALSDLVRSACAGKKSSRPVMGPVLGTCTTVVPPEGPSNRTSPRNRLYRNARAPGTRRAYVCRTRPVGKASLPSMAAEHSFLLAASASICPDFRFMILELIGEGARAHSSRQLLIRRGNTSKIWFLWVPRRNSAQTGPKPPLQRRRLSPRLTRSNLLSSKARASVSTAPVSTIIGGYQRRRTCASSKCGVRCAGLCSCCYTTVYLAKRFSGCVIALNSIALPLGS